MTEICVQISCSRQDEGVSWIVWICTWKISIKWWSHVLSHITYVKLLPMFVSIITVPLTTWLNKKENKGNCDFNKDILFISQQHEYTMPWRFKLMVTFRIWYLCENIWNDISQHNVALNQVCFKFWFSLI